MTEGRALDHVDEHGQACTRHAPAREKLMMYAALGSRVSGFHHDAASKLQSLVMALDEISELIGEEPSDVRTATQTAQASLQQLHVLLTANRALAKAPQVVRTLLPELLARSAERHGVRLSGEVPSMEVLVAPPSMTHAFAMLLDMVAGAPAQGRRVDVGVSSENGRATIRIAGGVEPTHANVSELIAIATFVVARESGALRCATKGFVVELPLA
jgi:hypothetical protein